MTARHRIILLDAATTALDALVILAPDDPRSLSEGRLFANGKRIHDERELLDAGIAVSWYAARAAANEFPLLLGQQEGILAVHKPAAWSSEPDRTGMSTCLRSYLLEQTKLRELHVGTRLDVGVSGLVLVSTQAESRRHLARLIEGGTLHRSYLAIAEGTLPPSGRFQGSVDAEKREAITDYECLAHTTLPEGTLLGTNPTSTTVSLVAFKPKTGRRHQLRIHAARSSHPLVGDRRYDGPKRLVLSDGRVIALSRILLQAVDTELTLPSGKHWSIHCPIDEEMGRFWELLGGKYGQIPQ